MSTGRRSADPVTGLTPNQETFCVELGRTGNATEAYRKAYNCGKMKPATISRNAAELVSNPKIATRLAALRSEVRRMSGITLVDHLATLRELRDEARSLGQYGPAVSAETGRGKVSGLYDGAQDEDSPAPRRIVVEIVDGRK